MKSLTLHKLKKILIIDSEGNLLYHNDNYPELIRLVRSLTEKETKKFCKIYGVDAGV